MIYDVYAGRKKHVYTLLFWELTHCIGNTILDNSLIY